MHIPNKLFSGDFISITKWFILIVEQKIVLVLNILTNVTPFLVVVLYVNWGIFEVHSVHVNVLTWKHAALINKKYIAQSNTTIIYNTFEGKSVISKVVPKN